MSEVKNAVQKLINEVEQRNAKIKAKISGLQLEVSTVKTKINQLTRTMIDFDLAGDTKSQAATDKELSRLRAVLSDLTGRIQAYEQTLGDVRPVRDGLPEVLNAVREQQAARSQTYTVKVARVSELEQRMKEIRQEVDSLKNEIQLQALHGSHPEERMLLPLLELIEPRPVQRGRVMDYLKGFLDGGNVEVLLDGYHAPEWIPPQQKRVYFEEKILRATEPLETNVTRFYPPETHR